MPADETSLAATGDGAAGLQATADEAIQQAKRAYALKNFEQAVEHYASALEIKTKEQGDAAPECVDLYFAYGKALLENAIAQNSVLGKEESSAPLDGEGNNEASGSGANASDARIHFGEDAGFGEDSNDFGEGNPEEQTVDLFSGAAKAEPEIREDGGDEGENGAEPEDDFNAAWEVLEVARSLYEAQKNADNETKLKLADTYIALGDVSLETEKLEQAVSDYTAAVALKTELLPPSSRQIAEVHYKLCIIYDMTPGRLANAIHHAQEAESSVRARLSEINARLQGNFSNHSDPKGKGKAVLPLFALDTQVEDMTKSQLESEVKELEGLLEEVLLKIEELKTSPDTAEISAPDLVARELDRDLGVPVASKPQAAQVNDLTSMVVKKKKQTQEVAGDKRKAEEDVTGSSEKKVKVDGPDV